MHTLNRFTPSYLFKHALKLNELAISPELRYGPRQAAYDLKKLRGKRLVDRIGSSHRYRSPTEGLRAIAGLVLIRDKVIKPLLASCCQRKRGPKPKNAAAFDAHYERLQVDMQHLLDQLGFTA